jgi:RNA polymerase sigma factor (sigma-70 family)
MEELVRRRMDFVYSSALRQVGDVHLAEDVAQAVFVLLARKARSVPPEGVMGWLFNTTRYVARNAMKAEARRRKHERQAGAARLAAGDESAVWERISPDLDHAIASLGRGEREVLLLQYFGGRSLAEVGMSLGISESAAKKRSSRGIEHLRQIQEEAQAIVNEALNH